MQLRCHRAPRLVALYCVCALVLLLLPLLALPTAATEVYLKLLPAKELCVGHYVFRDPEGDPVKVSFTHRSLTPRLAALRLTAYAPSDSLDTRGAPIDLKDDGMDTYGDISSLFFDAETTGVYMVCIKTRLRTPILGMEMHFSASNDYVEPPVVDNGEAVVIDKPVEIADYDDRLKMLKLSVRTTRDELRMAETRRFMFDHTSRSIFNVTVGFSLFNLLLAVLLSWWSERFMERYYLKEKSD